MVDPIKLRRTASVLASGWEGIGVGGMAVGGGVVAGVGTVGVAGWHPLININSAASKTNTGIWLNWLTMIFSLL